jgi:hypothetical protein
VVAIVVGIVLLVVGVAGFVAGWGSEPAASSASRVTTTSGVPTNSTRSDAESPDAFLAAYVGAIQRGDQTFLFDRLHPVVVARYGADACRAALGMLTDPQASLRLLSTSSATAWDYTSDGLTKTVPDTTTFVVDGTVQGASGQREYHFTRVDGRYRSFVDCGTPLGGAS